MSKCNCQRQDFSILYIMVFFILMNSCTTRDAPSSTAIRNIVAQECVSPNELKRELRRQE